MRSLILRHVFRYGPVILPLLFFAVGCSKEQRGGSRVETSAVTGQVIVDGAPASNLQVKLQPHTGPRDETLPTPSAYTDEEGRFEIGTYEGNDGAPLGDYVVTFMWGQINLLNGQYGGPDKLNGRYADPSKSEIAISVKEGEEIDLGEIQLSTK